MKLIGKKNRLVVWLSPGRPLWVGKMGKKGQEAQISSYTINKT